MNVMRSSYKINNEEAQAKINQIIFDHRIKETDIARALSITPQNLSYQLHQSSNLDREYERGIYIYFRSMGIIQYQRDHCQMITDHFLEFTSIINQQISILSNTVRKALSDGTIGQDEKQRLLSLTKTLRAESNKELDELDSAIRGLSCGENYG